MSRPPSGAALLLPVVVASIGCLGAAPAVAAPLAVPAASTASAPTATGKPVRVVTLRDPRLLESSGLVLSPTHADLVWTVNDSGSGPVVYGVSTRTGRTRAVLRLRGIDFRDTEAMTATTGPDGRGLLWVGDIGDNNRVRESVVLRLVREPTTVTSATVTPVSLRVRYPGGAADAETLLWTPDGRLLVVTKELLSAQVLQVPPAAVRAALGGKGTEKAVVAQRLATVAQGLVTDGAALPDGRIVLRGYGDAVVYAAPSRGQMEALEQVPLPSQPQGETLAAERDGVSVLVGSEGERQPLWRVPVPGAAGTPSHGASAKPPTSRPPVASSRRVALWLAGGGLGLVSVAAVTGARRRGRRRR
jgi:hypothetical protein